MQNFQWFFFVILEADTDTLYYYLSYNQVHKIKL